MRTYNPDGTWYDTNGMLHKADGDFAKGNKPSNGFDKHPENRNKGAWNKANSPRGQMEAIMKMSDSEIEKLMEDTTKTTFQRSFANVLYLARTATDITEAESVMRILEKMIDQVYGKMPQVSITTEADDETKEATNSIIKGVLIP